MKLKGLDKDNVIAVIRKQYQEVDKILVRVDRRVGQQKRSIDMGQAAFLYRLVKKYQPAMILEIGTFLGFSAAIMAEAVPKARIITLNPKGHEVEVAQKNLRYYPGVIVKQQLSWDYYAATTTKFNMIFVDGDHAQIKRDLPFWDRLLPGGIFLFHDYSPAGTYRPCPPVFEAVNEFAQQLGKDEPDILLIDNGNVGMAGFFRD